MAVSFKDRVVVVTGAGGGLGRTYALEIARLGGAVVVNDLGGNVDGENASTSMADQVVNEIRNAGGKALANYDSVATSEGGEAIASAALREFGRIDGLINNAGILRNAPFEELRVEDRDALWAVHLAGTFNVTKPVYRQMVKQRYGRILFTASTAGLLGNREQSAYGAAKAGTVGLMNALAQEGREHGVLCNALAPVANSRMGEKMNPDHAAEMIEAVAPFGDSATPEFVTAMAVYLVSEANTATHEIYSAAFGRFARMFIGVCAGWSGPQGSPASPDDIADNIDKIRDTSNFAIPDSLIDEFRVMKKFGERV